jgi:hypothetical protein
MSGYPVMKLIFSTFVEKVCGTADEICVVINFTFQLLID